MGGTNIPPGLRLQRTFRGHEGGINKIAWSPDGRLLSSVGDDGAVRTADIEAGRSRVLTARARKKALSIAWSADGNLVAVGWDDETVWFWQRSNLAEPAAEVALPSSAFALAWHPRDSVLICGLRGGEVVSLQGPHGASILLCRHRDGVRDVAWSGTGELASASTDGTVRVRRAGAVLTLDCRSPVNALSWQPSSGLLAVACEQNAFTVWDTSGRRARQVASVEGHVGAVNCVAYSPDGRLLVSKSDDATVRFWNASSLEQVAQLHEETSGTCLQGLAFSADGAYLGTRGQKDTVVRVWSFESSKLLAGQGGAKPLKHKTCKLVLVGDSGVGKSSLGSRLARGEFEQHDSTHGQQFWLVPRLRGTAGTGDVYEAVLWDLAGQSDYRLIHALSLEDADVALIVFDPTHGHDPLEGVEFWVRQLRGASAPEAGSSDDRCEIVLVAARIDRGSPRLTKADLEAFCAERRLRGPILTSAKDGSGIDDLINLLRALIPWEKRPSTVTTETFKKVKDHCLSLKAGASRQILVTHAQLREQLAESPASSDVTDGEIASATSGLEKQGYVRILRGPRGGDCHVLLAPEVLNNLAASLVVEARRNERGLGCLDEAQLCARRPQLPELQGLCAADGEVLLDAATSLFLKHNVCFREIDPLTSKTYLVFPELIHLRRPDGDGGTPTEDAISYGVRGAVANLYASLVVLIGYTPVFSRTEHWHNQARYQVGEGKVCGFRLDGQREGELEFVLYFGQDVPCATRTLFQGLFESFLTRRDVTVSRHVPVLCRCGATLERAVVRNVLRQRKTRAFCNDCGQVITLHEATGVSELSLQSRPDVAVQQRVADRRTRFEQTLFQLQTFAQQQGTRSPSCFVSYSWGDAYEEQWVEHILATDLRKAGISVLLDKWENARFGASVARFVGRLAETERVIVVGTPNYRRKYENRDPDRGFITAAEFDLIANRLTGTEQEKETVLPVLLSGDRQTSLPPFLQGRVCADCRSPEGYFAAAFELICTIYGLSSADACIGEIKKSLGS